MERYLEAGDIAFENVIRRIEPLPPVVRRQVLLENKDNISSVKGKKGGVIEKDGAFVDFTPGWPGARVDSAHPIEDGIYRCRVAVWPHDPNDHRTLSVGVFVGPLFGTGKRYFKGMFDVTGTPEKPRIIEFETFMHEGHTIHVLPWIYPRSCNLARQGRAPPRHWDCLGRNVWPLGSEFPIQSSNETIWRF